MNVQKPKFYVHPINLKEAYIDTEPVRKVEFMLSIAPDTIGPFDSRIAAIEWVNNRLNSGFKTCTDIVSLAKASSKIMLGG